MATAISVRGLRKSYGSLEAVRGIDLDVEEGECVAILGPNGAGKTTTVEILEGHRQRSAGEISVLGFDPQRGGRRYRERIGIVLQSAGFDQELSVEETVRLWADYYPAPLAVGEVVDRVGLAEKRGDRVKTLSGGQRRRLDLALGLVGDPDLVFLDEPTTGFDPSARRKAWDLVARARRSCSPPTTWMRRSTWRTGWWSWPVERSLRKGTRPPWAAVSRPAPW